MNYTSKGFIYGNYIVSINHHLPIDKAYINDRLVEIYTKPIWNELLILYNNIGKKSNVQINITFPKKNSVLYINKQIQFKMETTEYFHINHLDFLPKNIYLKAKMINTKIKYQSLSGSPVYSNNKLIGIFAKCDYHNKYVYILPIYYLIKTLNKYNNNGIYNVSCSDKKITKINNHYVKNNMVYHPSLKIYLNVNSFCVLEGDINNKIILNNNIIKPYETINDKLPIKCNNNIIYKNGVYIVNFTLLAFIRFYYNNYYYLLIEFIKNNYGKKIIIYAKDNRCYAV